MENRFYKQKRNCYENYFPYKFEARMGDLVVVGHVEDRLGEEERVVRRDHHSICHLLGDATCESVRFRVSNTRCRVQHPSSSSSSLLLSSLELSDTQVYEPLRRAIFGNASHFSEVVVLKSPSPSEHLSAGHTWHGLRFCAANTLEG